jgi:hypothetical protein
MGVTGTIQRYHGDEVLLYIEGTEEQIETFYAFLNTCVSQRMIEGITSHSEAVVRRRAMQQFVIRTDHTRLQCASRRRGVRTGTHSGGEYEKDTEFSADSI